MKNFINNSILTKTYLLLIMSIFCIYGYSQPKELYVSTTASSNGTGSFDNPYNTIDKARLEARNFNQVKDVDIIVRGGNYYFDSPLMLGYEDGGRNGFKVKYRTYANEKVVLSGGKSIPSTAWIPDQRGIWKADLTSLNPTNTVFRELWVDGKKATRAQCGIELTTAPITNLDDPFSLEFNINTPNGNIISSATHKEDIEIWTYWKWMANIVKIASINGNHITTKTETPYFTGFASTTDNPQKNFGVENAYEFIDVPGEWYYDKSTKYLYYYPVGGSNPNNSEIIFPILEKIVVATDVSNVEFNGFTFSYATWLYPNNFGYITGQGSIYVRYIAGQGLVNQVSTPANVEFTNCSQITVRNNLFSHLGAEAVCFQNASSGNLITNNKFDDIAGTAIRIGNGKDYDILNPSNATKNNTISNNVISNSANEYRSNCGIWLGYVNNNNVINNKLTNLPYSGISAGYPISPNNTPTLLGANTISNNEISDVVNTLRDGGAIYNFGLNTGQSTIDNNKICDVNVLRENDIKGIYLDEGSGNFLVSNNHSNLTENSFFTNGADLSRISLINNDWTKCQWSSHWIDYSSSYGPEYHTAAQDIGNLGVRFADVNHDGLEDMLYFRWISSTNIQRGVYLNECGKWGNRLENSDYCLPYHLYVDGMGDMGVQFVDFDHDGYKDIIYSRYNYPDQSRAYRNTGSGWEYTPAYNSPIPMYADGIGDLGVRFMDVNGDKWPDLVYSRWLSSNNQHRMVFLNSHSGWIQTSDPAYSIPSDIMFTDDAVGDLGVQIIDLNGDEKEDLLFWRWGHEHGAYLQNTIGNGWYQSTAYSPQYPIAADGMGILGVKFIDVDHDGSVDMIYNRQVTPTRTEKGAFLNKNGTWITGNSDYAPVIPTYIDFDGKDQGVLTVDLNGDGFKDILQGYWRNNIGVTSKAYLNNSMTIQCNTIKLQKAGDVNVDGNVTNINATPITNGDFSIESFPNPFKGDFKILLNVNSKERIEISLYSLDGKLIKDIPVKTFEKGSYTLVVNIKEQTGIYLLRAQSKNTVQYKKVIKE